MSCVKVGKICKLHQDRFQKKVTATPLFHTNATKAGGVGVGVGVGVGGKGVQVDIFKALFFNLPGCSTF
jgi:hypothetical protein